MTVIPYGDWRPDLPVLGNPCVTATNVYPTAQGYAPFPGATVITDALAAAPVGVISFKRVNGDIETFAGTAQKLYRLNGTSWTDVSAGGGTYTSATYWRFTVYGDRLVATNGTDNPQKFDLGSDTEFSTLTNAPICKQFIVIHDILVAVGVLDGSTYEVKWSAVNNSEQWDADCGGGADDFPDGGPVMGGIGGEFGIVIQEYALTRMNFVGGDLRFTFDNLEGGLGSIATDSLVRYKGRAFYLSEEGFQVFNGAESQNISDGAVSNTFFAALTYGSLSQVIGALDPRNSCVVWSYPISGGSELIIFNYRFNRWSAASVEVFQLHTSLTSSGPVLAGFDGDNKLVRFTGDALTATLSTGRLSLINGQKAFVRSVRPLADAASTVTVGKSEELGDAETTTSVATNTHGRAPVRSNGRYHSFKTVISDAFTEITGVDIEAVPSGRRN